MRFLAAILALSLMGAAPALAQDNAPAAVQIARASRALAAIWRPISTTTPPALAAACAGAASDLEALDGAIPQDLSARNLAAVHVAHGLAIVPTDENPADMFVFPDTSFSWLASGVATITSANEATGEVSFRDANGQSVNVQLGHVAGQLLMRLSTPSGQSVTYAGCTPTVAQPAPAGTPG